MSGSDDPRPWEGPLTFLLWFIITLIVIGFLVVLANLVLVMNSGA